MTRGRPPIDEPRDRVLRARVTTELFQRVKRYAGLRGLSNAVRELIERGLGRDKRREKL